MKKQFNHLKLFLPALLILFALSSNAQVNKEYTFELTTTKVNTMASKALIDVPELTDNSGAIIVATLMDNARVPNPHPMGAWYYQGKWNIFNSDHAPLPLGLTFKITYFLKTDNDHFVHIVENIESEGSYINNAMLNDYPNARFAFFQNHGAYANGRNPYEAEVIYSTTAGKWCIRNKGGRELTKGASYNIVVYSSGSKLVTAPLVTTIPLTTVPPVASNTASGWSLNGGHLNNTNTGNVGIANNNPAYQLDVNGRMRIRSGGNNTVSAGLWLNNNANTESAFIGMEDDAHVGFFGKVGGWKFGMNTNTGALKINGSEGQSGQVLVSNGAAAPGYTTIGNLIRAEMKGGSGRFEATVNGTEYHLNQLTHTITLTAKSRIIISAQVSVLSDFLLLGDPSVLNFVLKINNSKVLSQAFTSAGHYINVSICNYMIELDPGTHTIDFYDEFNNGPKHWIEPKYSSVIIIPVD